MSDNQEEKGFVVKDGNVESEINFSSFIVSLATQALMQLGQMSAPVGVDVPVDPKAAKQTIDIIEMIYKKTLGNLDSQEKGLIEEVLHNLRVSFIKTK